MHMTMSECLYNKRYGKPVVMTTHTAHTGRDTSVLIALGTRL